MIMASSRMPLRKKVVDIFVIVDGRCAHVHSGLNTAPKKSH